jgi:subfamily B ATP-binding cassette protein HlyB/CyaB
MQVIRMTMKPPSMDTGLNGLVVLARWHQIAIDPTQLAHRFKRGDTPFSTQDILLAAKAIGLKARSVRTTEDALGRFPLPALARHRDGGFFVIARVKIEDERVLAVLIHDLRESAPREVTVPELKTLWTGDTVLLARKGSSGNEGKVFDISWFVPSLIKYRHLFAEVVIASFLIQCFALITPLFFQVVMDKVLVHRGFTTLDVLALGYFFVITFDAIIGWVRNYVFSHTTNRVDVELGARLFQHLMALPMSFFQSRQVGQTVARVRELDSIRTFITGTALTLLIDLGFTVIFLALMWYYSAALALVVMATIPLYILLSVLMAPTLRRRLEEKFRHGAANQAFLTESMVGVETIKSMAVEPQMQRRWEEQLSHYVGAAFRAQNLGNTANQIAGFIGRFTTLVIIWWGAQWVIAGALTVGQLVAFNMMAGRVSGPILKLVQLWQDFQQAGISLRRLGDILNAPPESGFDPARSALPRLQGQVSFEHVRFRYRPDGPVILDDVSLQVNAGEVIGIVGRSGSGKSTLTKLIQRLHVAEAGRVRVDGVDLAMVDAQWLRRNIGVVLQESFLFDRSVRENIALINPGLPMERVIEAATMAGAHEFITELPQAYDTPVGELGVSLSGGQKQRLAIARALIGQPRILVFDEATSALDYESERTIQNNMQHICRGRTVFIIAHRLSTVRQCDRILVLDQGRLVESGSHEELMRQAGHYASLYTLQNQVPRIRPVTSTDCAQRADPPPGREVQA